MGILNDGKFALDHGSDASNQRFAGCTSKFRNTPGPVITRVIYYHGTLSVLMDTSGGQKASVCFTEKNINLPTGYYFGLSAATGGLVGTEPISRQQWFVWG